MGADVTSAYNNVRLARFESYQIVIRFDAKQIPEVAESQWGVRLEAEVRIVMRWGQVASLTGMCDEYQAPQETETYRPLDTFVTLK